MLAAIFILSLPVLAWFRVPLRALAALRKFIYLYLFLILLQSFFVPGGEPLLTLGKLTLLTSGGIIYGLSILLRFLILAGAGLILAQCNQAELLLALVKLRLPYEIVFMVQLGIRFIPVLTGELQNMFNGIQLRGVDLRKIYKRKVLAVYVSLLPRSSTVFWQKAEKLSILLSCAVSSYPGRTYYRDISAKPRLRGHGPGPGRRSRAWSMPACF